MYRSRMLYCIRTDNEMCDLVYLNVVSIYVIRHEHLRMYVLRWSKGGDMQGG
jgi:hypothetical protein